MKKEKKKEKDAKRNVFFIISIIL